MRGGRWWEVAYFRTKGQEGSSKRDTEIVRGMTVLSQPGRQAFQAEKQQVQRPSVGMSSVHSRRLAKLEGTE